MEHAKRARVACKSCHARRVKCDATVTRPCWNCKLRGAQCELIESRRGKYLRKRASETGAQNKAVYPGNDFPPQPANVPTPQTTTEENLPANSSPSVQPPSPPTTTSRQEDGDREDNQSNEGPEMLYARIAESQPSKREPSFRSGNTRSFYMGESFSLSFVVNSISNCPSQGTRGKRHYPIPANVAEHAYNAAEGLKDSDPATMAYLNMHGAFRLPSQDVSDELVRVFFQCIHPAFPIFDRQLFSSLYQQRRASLLALHTINFLSFTACSDSLLEKAGYSDRLTARRTCYLRAKSLYDMDYEKDKVQLVTVLFLLGFWWEGPEDQKDTWHWLGSAISLAQTLGMHRSTANSGMLPRHQSLWKRIWWSIYTRDRHAAAALGRPMRIRDEDCDIGMLTDADFLVDQGYDSILLGHQEDYHIMHTVEMSKLAIILGEILAGQFSPQPKVSNNDGNLLVKKLDQWEIELPVQLRRQPVDESLSAPFWSCMLHASYHNCQILLFRSFGNHSVSLNEVGVKKKAIAAADSTTRIAEDLLAAGTLSFSQLHLVPAIFAALSIHSNVIHCHDHVREQLAENRARQCLLAMSELAKSWPVAGWILRLFINLMKRLTGQSLGCDSNLGQNRSNGPGYYENSGLEAPSAVIRPTTNRNMLNSAALDNLVQRSAEHDQSSARIGEWNEIQHIDQLLSDVLWAPDQNNFDFDPLFQSQSNGLSFNFGSLADTVIPDYPAHEP